MKKVSNFKNEALHEEQLHILVEVMSKIKSVEDIEHFLRCFLTKSERTYISQRLDIARMLSKHFKYKQIEEKIGVPSATISRTQELVEKGGERLKQIILSYKYKPKRQKVEALPIHLPHYSGAIDLRKP